MPAAPVDFLERLKEIDRFFAGRSQEHRTMHRLISRLETEKISYAIMGGMAVFANGHRQTTDDVDVLLTFEGFRRFRDRLCNTEYLQGPKRRSRFIDRRNGIPVDIVLCGSRPGWFQASPIWYPDPAAAETIGRARYIGLRTLVELKLAIRRHKDLGDVAALIRVHNLDEAFADRLHPSVRGDYIECLEEKRRDDEYDARS